MKTAFPMLIFVVAAMVTRLSSADYDPPTFEQLAVYSTTIVDATVVQRTKEGHLVLKIHGYLKGKDAPTTITGIHLTCKEGRLPPELWKAGERYVFCLYRDRLYELYTYFPVRHNFKNGFELWHREFLGKERTYKSESLTFGKFRARIVAAQKKMGIFDLVDLPGLNHPLYWRGDAELDPEKGPLRYRLPSGETLQLLKDLPRPWTVSMLEKEYRAALALARRTVQTTKNLPLEHRRYFAVMLALAATNDVRAVLNLGDTAFGKQDPFAVNAAAGMKSYGIDAAWWKANEKQMRAQARVWEKRDK